MQKNPCGYDFEGSSQLQKNIFNTTFFNISFLQPEHFELVFVVAAGVEQMQKNIDFKNSGLKLID